jgi:hypothetical protein
MGKNNQSKYYYCARCQRAVYVPNFRIRKVHLGNDPHGQTKWEFTCWGAVPLRWWRRHRQQVDSPLPRRCSTGSAAVVRLAAPARRSSRTRCRPVLARGCGASVR